MEATKEEWGKNTKRKLETHMETQRRKKEKAYVKPNSNLYKKQKAPQATMIKIIGTMKKTSRTQYGLRSKIATKEKKDAAGMEFSPNIFTS